MQGSQFFEVSTKVVRPIDCKFLDEISEDKKIFFDKSSKVYRIAYLLKGYDTNILISPCPDMREREETNGYKSKHTSNEDWLTKNHTNNFQVFVTNEFELTNHLATFLYEYQLLSLLILIEADCVEH
jgi:hypothetical protein